jgi:hypothetical protein
LLRQYHRSPSVATQWGVFAGDPQRGGNLAAT